MTDTPVGEWTISGMNQDPPHIVVRLLVAAPLGVFAFAPCYIAFRMLAEVAKAPLSAPLEAFVGLALCLPIAYMLLLLVYRAITWRGRGSDDGLLPPLAMLVVALLFSLVGAAGLVLMFSRGEYLWCLAAVGYLAAAIPVVLSNWRRLHGA